jgi:membrane associated rhomboid family serine protease
MTVSITLIIIAITSIISFLGFNNEEVINNLIFYPPAITERKQWYRFFTCGVIHKDIPHLLFNMYALYLFGQGQVKDGVEYLFQDIFGISGKTWYLAMYIISLAVCLIPTYLKNKNNANYMSLGASGAVSAVVFSYILLNPLRGVGLIFIPIFIPGFLFGILYLVISYLLSKRGGSTINHSAHIWGALFGVCFVLVASKLFSSYPVLEMLIHAIKNFQINNLFQTY